LFFVVACATPYVYIDKTDLDFNQTDLNKLITEASILSTKTKEYKQNDTQIEIVYSLPNTIGNYTTDKNIFNNFLENSVGTRSSGYSKIYHLTKDSEDKNTKIEFTVWDRGIKDGVDNIKFNTQRDDMFSMLRKLKFKVNDGNIKIRYGLSEVPYKVAKITKKMKNGKTAISFDYRTVYNGVMVRANFYFGDKYVKSAQQYVDESIKFITLKILVDTKKITPEEYLNLRNDNKKVYKELTVENSN
jgi:hypothetical protein